MRMLLPMLSVRVKRVLLLARVVRRLSTLALMFAVTPSVLPVCRLPRSRMRRLRLVGAMMRFRPVVPVIMLRIKDVWCVR